MEHIFHEKQQDALCAQHCLNSLLQSSYYTAADLAEIGRRIDENEKQLDATLNKASQNFDDSGFFSIQVIAEALKIWNLEIIPYNSKDSLAVMTRADPTSHHAFICNLNSHWFTIRKIGNQWFNLNSMLVEPELISTTYLSLLLAQLQNEGYSIFIVDGNLPECDADNLLRITPAIQSVRPPLISDSNSTTKTTNTTIITQSDLQRALEQSALEAALLESRKLTNTE